MKSVNYQNLQITMRGQPQEYFTRLLAWLRDHPVCRSAKLSGAVPTLHGTRVFILRGKEFGAIQVTTAQVERDISITTMTWRMHWRNWPLARVREIVDPILGDFFCWHLIINLHEHYRGGLDPQNERSAALVGADIDIPDDQWCRYPSTAPLRPERCDERVVLTPATYLHEELLRQWRANEDSFAAAQRVVPEMRVMRLKTGRWIICPCEGLGLPAINDRLRIMYGALRGIAVQPIPTTFYDADWKLPLGIGIGVPGEQQTTP